MAEQRWQSRQFRARLDRRESVADPGAVPRWQRPVRRGLAGLERRHLAFWLGGLTALFLTLTAFFVVLYWFAPVPLPQLAVLTARYRAPLVPPNAFALHDANLLLSQRRLFATEEAGPDSLDAIEMRALLDTIVTQRFHRPFFGRARSTVIVYVNALGISLWDPQDERPVAVVLADDFAVPTAQPPEWGGDSSRLVTVAQMLDRIIESSAASKVLVLDCQHVDQCWPLGVVDNQFVATVRAELKARPASELQGLYVLFSCSAGETTWVDPVARQSVFAEAFARGIGGEADWAGNGGDGDGRVTLCELTGYLAGVVPAWSFKNRGRAQTPLLEAFGQETEQVVLATLGRVQSKFVAALEIEPAATASDRAALESAWTEHFTLARQKPPPYWHAAAEWRAYESCVRRAEELYLAADLAAMHEELSAANSWKKSLAVACGRCSVAGASYSLALGNLPHNTACPALDLPAPAEDVVSVPTGLFANLQRIVSNFIAGELPLQQAMLQLTTLQKEHGWLPIEAHLISVAGEQLAGAEQPVDRQETLRSAVALRVLAERTAALGGLGGPEVLPWVRARMGVADRSARILGDLSLAPQSSRAALGEDVSCQPEQVVRRQYDSVRADAQILGNAIVLSRQILVQLPRWVGRALALRWQQEESAPVVVLSLTDELCERLVVLQELLTCDPGALTEAARLSRIREVQNAYELLGETYKRLSTSCNESYQQLAAFEGPAQSPGQWHATREALLAPVLDTNGTPAEAASRRLRLLDRLQLALETGSPSSLPALTAPVQDDVEAIPPGERVARSIGLVCQLLVLCGADAQEPPPGSAGAAGFYIGDRWRCLIQLATAKPVDPGNIEALRRVARAEALAGARLVPQGDAWCGELLLHRWQSQYFAWMARRSIEDFWGPDRASLGSYFVYWARQMLRVARRQMQGTVPTPWITDVDRFLEERRQATAKVVAQPSRVRFLGDKQNEKLQVRVEAIGSLPTGVAFLRLAGDQQLVRISQESAAPSPSLYGFSLEPLTREGAGELWAEALFRGHCYRQRIPLAILDDETGPAIVYRKAVSPTAQMLVRPAGGDARDVKLLFVLDCSSSMYANNRIGVMRQVLERFAETTPPGALDVGIRLFGDRVVWTRDNPEAEVEARRDSRNVLPVRKYNRGSLQATLRLLEPKGSSPLFFALLEAQKDFTGIDGGAKTIIVVSDGADNWAMAGKKPGLAELAEAYSESDIRIHTIGFQAADADFSQLSEIARIGRGRAVKASQADELLQSITGLVGLLQYAIRAGDRVLDGFPRPLHSNSPSVDLPPNVYQVEVSGADGMPLAQLPGVHLRSGQLHRLLYRNSQLWPALPQFATTLGQATVGDVSLIVLEAQPVGEHVRLRFALLNRRDAYWWPYHVRAQLRSVKTGAVWPLQELVPNAAGYAVPVWSVDIEGWPEDASAAQLSLSWSDSPDELAPLPITVAWGHDPSASLLPAGVSVVFGKTRPRRIDGRSQSSAVVKMIFPVSVRDQMAQWVIGCQAPVEYSRRIFNSTHGVQTNQLVVIGQANPRQLVLRPSRPADKKRSVSVQFAVGLPTLNQTTQ